MNKKLKLALVLVFFVGVYGATSAQDRLDPIKTKWIKGCIPKPNRNQPTSCKNPNDSKAYSLLAELQMKLGKIDLACATYSMMESMKLCDEQVYFDYGLALKWVKLNTMRPSKKKIQQSGWQNERSRAKTNTKLCFCQRTATHRGYKEGDELNMNTPMSEFGAVLHDQVVVFNGAKSPFMTPQTAALLKRIRVYIYAKPFKMQQLRLCLWKESK